MITCKNCGAELQDNATFCTSCGAKVEQPAAQPNQNANQNPNDFAAKVASFNNTADTTAEFDPQDIEQNKVMGVLAYLSWLVLIPILAAPQSKFARYHANQGLVLAIVEIGWLIVSMILGFIFGLISWYLGMILGTLLNLVNIVFLVFAILGIVNAAQGKAKELPIIGKIRLLK